MKTAIVAGALANKPRNGGEAWVRLSWVLGLRRLGFDVFFVEQIDGDRCVGADGRRSEFGASLNRDFFERVVDEFGLAGRAGLLADGGEEGAGLGLEALTAAAAGADLLVNLSGHLTLAPLLAGPRSSLYVDLDPGFTQIWHADPAVAFALPRHDHYATVGLNLGAAGCPIPDCGRPWIPTLPPVLLEHWPSRPPPSASRFSTVATWRSPSGQLQLGGRTFGLKHHQFRRLLDLPASVPEADFELALEIHPGDAADRESLREHGWELVDPAAATPTPAAYRDYLGASGAEFSVAQGVYAETASGWFSDRTAAYLASGRPAVVEETGLPENLVVGEGLLTFTGLEGAAAAARRVVADPVAESEAARDFAERHLDSDLVLERLLGAIGVAA